MKKKTYIITLSKRFLKGHPKAGQSTYFKQKFLNTIHGYQHTAVTVYNDAGRELYDLLIEDKKIHTIRSNYTLWEKRIKEVQEGKAILSIREWKGVPYQEKQIIIKDLTADDGVGIQKLVFLGGGISVPTIGTGRLLEAIHATADKFGVEALASNDGLNFQDFKAWFKGYDLSEPMAIIHFTKFRY